MIVNALVIPKEMIEVLISYYYDRECSAGYTVGNEANVNPSTHTQKKTQQDREMMSGRKLRDP